MSWQMCLLVLPAACQLCCTETYLVSSAGCVCLCGLLGA